MRTLGGLVLEPMVLAAFIFLAFLAFVLVASVAMVMGFNQELWISLVWLVFAAALGWLAGSWMSPYRGTPEEEQFSRYARVVGTLVTGFVAGKAETIISYASKLEPPTSLRIMSSGAALLLATIGVSVSRRYVGQLKKT